MPPDTVGLVSIRRALLSVDDPTGLAGFARALAARGVDLLATEGTRARLEAEGLPVRSTESLTGIGAWFGGRVKTLHPALLGGILAPRTAAGEAELRERGLLPIDLVAVNFYPFGRRLREEPGRTDLAEHIDVGGVTLARAAAKNAAFVAVVTDPGQYGAVADELAARDGALSAETRRALAVAAFERTAAYDGLIAAGLAGPVRSPDLPAVLRFEAEPLPLRYGENPHQPARVYRLVDPLGTFAPPAPIRVEKGSGLSYTNLLDLETAVATVAEFPTPTAAVVKHATPIGVASGTTVGEAVGNALATDPVARYGCVVAVNRPVEADVPPALSGVFVDVLAAPSISAEARAAVDGRAKLRIVLTDPPPDGPRRWDAHMGLGRLLFQEASRRQLVPDDFRLVAGQKATPHEACSLDFAWRVVRHAKSNAIVLARGSTTVGIGSGQPTRVKAVELAVEVAGARAKGAVLASDALFPFADGVEAAGAAGIRAIIQPGGSLRDAEVLAAAEKWGIAMYFTGWRVFRH